MRNEPLLRRPCVRALVYLTFGVTVLAFWLVFIWLATLVVKVAWGLH